jgi:5-methylcytosine-specific restriction endonuclease McrA
MKRCGRCRKMLSFECFSKNRSMADGFQHYCRTCSKAAKQKYRQSEKGKLTESLYDRRPSLARYAKSDKFEIVQRRYLQSEKGRRTGRLRMQRLRKTEKYQLFEWQYRRSKKRKAVVKRYQSSEKGRLTRKLLSQGEKAQNYKRLYRAANQEKQEQYIREWLKTPQGKEYIARRHFHRRSVLERTPAKELITSVQWNEIKRKHNYSCVYCGEPESAIVKLTRDHIVPVTKGGLHTKENIVPACQPCNAKKGSKIISFPFARSSSQESLSSEP